MEKKKTIPFRNPALVILLLSLQVVALNLQIHDLAKYCHSFDGLTSTAWQPNFLVRNLDCPFFEFQRKNGKELHLAHGKGYCISSISSFSLRYAALSTRWKHSANFLYSWRCSSFDFCLSGWQAPVLATLNSAIVNYKRKRQQQRGRYHCFVLIG